MVGQVFVQTLLNFVQQDAINHNRLIAAVQNQGESLTEQIDSQKKDIDNSSFRNLIVLIAMFESIEVRSDVGCTPPDLLGVEVFGNFDYGLSAGVLFKNFPDDRSSLRINMKPSFFTYTVAKSRITAVAQALLSIDVHPPANLLGKLC